MDTYSISGLQTSDCDPAGDIPSLLDLKDTLPAYINCRESNVIDCLYAPSLKRSVKYVRGAGFFRSSVYRLMTRNLLEFCIRGGRISLITSTQWSRSDFEEARRSYKQAEEIAVHNFKNDLAHLLSEADTVDPTKMLCALILNGKLDIYIAVLRGAIYHEKKGYFEDIQGNIVAFDGSGNETLSALQPFDKGSAESFNVIANWMGHAWDKWGSCWVNELERLVDQDDSLSFPVVHLSQIDEEFIEYHNIDSFLENHRKLAGERQRKLRSKWDEIWGNRRTTSSRLLTSRLYDILFEHQKQGLLAWRQSGKHGVLEHATGSGKTVTAIAAIEEHLKTGGHVVVLVPSEPLLWQWNAAIKKWLGECEPWLLGAGEHGGQYMIDNLRAASVNPSIVIAIIHSFRAQVVLRKFNQIYTQSNREVLLIADECHKLGAPSYKPICESKPNFTLGLSATPRRQAQPIETARIFDFLGEVIHKYSLKQALDDGFLTPYDYEIRTVRLTASEQQRYDDLRKKIAQSFTRLPKKDDIPESLMILVFQARRIIRGAENKIDAAVDIISDRYESGQHWLVYCESEIMMDAVSDKLVEITGLSPRHYWSGMDRFQRRMEMDYFQKNAGVMLAIKCLDEGVDIPAISHGIILSSSKTKREFIQRRGRLLRRSSNKHTAYVFDTFALPSSNDAQSKFVLDELARGFEFAKTARNRIRVIEHLKSIMREYDIDDEEILLEPEIDEEV